MCRYFIIVFLFLFPFVMAGCSGNASDENAEANVNNSQADVYTDANAALVDGIKLLEAGETEKAIEVLNQAVTLDPDLADAYFQLGIAYSLIEFRDTLAAEETDEPVSSPESGEKRPKEKKTNSDIAFENAVEAYKKKTADNKEDHASFYNLGRSYAKLDQDVSAANALRQAVRLNPDDTEYQTELGSILIRLAKYSEAVAALKKALDLDPENLLAEDLLERAEAGHKRINFTVLPKDPSKPDPADANANSAPSPSDSDGRSPKPSLPTPPPKPIPTLVPVNKPKP